MQTLERRGPEVGHPDLDLGRRLAGHLNAGVDIQTVLRLKNCGYSLEQILVLLDRRTNSRL